MNISWGYRVAALYIGFASLIAFLVTKSVNEKVELVSSDYYEKELAYESQKVATELNLNLAHPAVVWCDAEGIRVELPSEMDASKIQGKIQVFRPSDKSLDFDVAIDGSKGLVQKVATSKLVAGMYRVKVDFSYDGISYYLEKQIVFRKGF